MRQDGSFLLVDESSTATWPVVCAWQHVLLVKLVHMFGVCVWLRVCMRVCLCVLFVTPVIVRRQLANWRAWGRNWPM